MRGYIFLSFMFSSKNYIFTLLLQAQIAFVFSFEVVLFFLFCFFKQFLSFSVNTAQNSFLFNPWKCKDYSCIKFVICVHIFFTSFIPVDLILEYSQLLNFLIKIICVIACKYLNKSKNKIYYKMLASDTFCTIFARDRGYQKHTFSLD